MVDNCLELFHREGLRHEIVHPRSYSMLLSAHVAVRRHPYDWQPPPKQLHLRLGARRPNHGMRAVVHPGVGQRRTGCCSEKQDVRIFYGVEGYVALRLNRISTVAAKTGVFELAE